MSKTDVVARIETPDWIAQVIALEEQDAIHHRESAKVRDIAIIVDRDARESVAAGLALLEHGYFPVPLFNALPHEAAVIPLRVVIDKLVFAARRRSEVALPNDAPPAFLLDARRHGGRIAIREGVFDNRSVMFETDFPSAVRFMQAGIRRVIVVQETEKIAPDLLDMVAQWQRAGLTIYVHDADTPTRI